MVFSIGKIKQIAREIWDSDETRVDLQRICRNKIKELRDNITDLEIADDIDTLISRVKREIEKYIMSFEEKNIPPNFEFDDCLPNILHRYGSHDNNNWIRKYQIQIKRAIKTLEPRAFEHFCRHILEINGITKSFVTRTSKEGGVDFYGLLEMCNYSKEVFLSTVKMRILGQAKCYSGDHKVGEPGIDEIRTKYSDFQTGRGKAFDILPVWFTGSNYPLICMVVTTTGFTRDAKKSALRDDIILRDGDQIVEDIIHSPQVVNWFEYDKNGNRIFRHQLFLGSFKE